MRWLFFWSLLASVLGSTVFFAPTFATNSYTIDEFHIEMQLARDDDGRATLTTTEVITVSYDTYTRGFTRSIPTTVHGNPNSLDVRSVKDPETNDVPYSTYTNDEGRRVLELEAAGDNVSGTKTYILTYTQRDVVRMLDGAERDEAYISLLGDDVSQPIELFTARVDVDRSLEDAWNGESACFTGSVEAAEACPMVAEDISFSTELRKLDARRDVVFSVGFVDGTFSPYEPVRLRDWIVPTVFIFAGIVIASIVAHSLWQRWQLNRK